MSVKLKSLALDLDRETNGGWVDSRVYPGVRYRVRGVRYQPYQDAVDAAAIRFSKSHVQTKPTVEAAQKVSGALVCDHLLLEWDGFDEPYTPETAKAALTDLQYRNVLNDVLGAAARVAEREVAFTDALGNASPGISATS